MALIKFQKANEAGKDVGVIFLNTDQIVAVSMGDAATEVQMSDGHTHWVKESPDEVVSLAQKV
jgi:hypothetical protein